MLAHELRMLTFCLELGECPLGPFVEGSRDGFIRIHSRIDQQRVRQVPRSRRIERIEHERMQRLGRGRFGAGVRTQRRQVERPRRIAPPVVVLFGAHRHVGPRPGPCGETRCPRLALGFERGHVDPDRCRSGRGLVAAPLRRITQLMRPRRMIGVDHRGTHGIGIRQVESRATAQVQPVDAQAQLEHEGPRLGFEFLPPAIGERPVRDDHQRCAVVQVQEDRG